LRDSLEEVMDFESYFINISGQLVDGSEESESSEPYFELEWDEDDIVNGKDFKIKVNAFNLEDEEYDVKLWIEFEDNDTIISERYDENEEKWKSGKYYLNEFFKGPGNESEKIEIRIKDKYEDFKGDVNLFFKTRDGSEIERSIEILEKEEGVAESQESEEPKVLEVEIESEPAHITGEVIRLGGRKESNESSNEASENLKTPSGIVYESKTEKIKKYSVFGFALLCVLICVLIAWRKLE